MISNRCGASISAKPAPTWICRILFFKGSRVWDLDGNKHLDLFCKFGALIVGHGNPEYNDRLKGYIDKVLSVDRCDLENEVCQRIIDRVPSAEMVRFGLSGTEAVQNAIRLGRAYTGKPKFVRFRGHYHGNADNIIGGKATSPDNPILIEHSGDMCVNLGRSSYPAISVFFMP